MDDALVGVRAPDKSALISDLSERAAAALALDAALIRRELLKREELGSTGVGAGIAIPHARIIGLPRPFGIVSRLDKSIDFAAIDGAPVDVVFLLLLSTAPSGDQLNALASVTRKLRDPVRATAIRRALSGAELYKAIAAE
jgi:PTS system nitrogen regulatory IIA component